MATWIHILSPLCKDKKPKSPRRLNYPKQPRYTACQRSVLEIDGIAVCVPDDLGKLSPSGSVIWSFEMGLEKINVPFRNAFPLKRLEGAEVIIGGAKLFFAHDSDSITPDDKLGRHRRKPNILVFLFLSE
jgi:hypothetical protein